MTKRIQEVNSNSKRKSVARSLSLVCIGVFMILEEQIILLVGGRSQDATIARGLFFISGSTNYKRINGTKTTATIPETDATINSIDPLHLDFFQSLFHGPSELKSLQQQNFSTFLDARDAQGQPGYIPDPTSLKRGVKAFIARSNTSLVNGRSDRFFDVVQNYERQYRVGTKTNFMLLRPGDICSPAGGLGVEQANGFKLLREKIQVAPIPHLTTSTRRYPKLLCIMYTFSGQRDNARTAALTWGIKCDGFLAFSNETIPSLGMVDLIHPGKEEWYNMWQKVRSMWAFVGKHYLHDYDYFHIAGDDTFLMTENLEHFWMTRMEPLNTNNKPIVTGAHAIVYAERNQDILIGGPGYTLNRAALHVFVTQGIHRCFPDDYIPREDQLLARCFNEQLNISLTDSWDPMTGEQLYHHQYPERVYNDTSKEDKYISLAKKYWSQQPHPTRRANHTNTNNNETIGDKDGLDAAYKYSVAFHYIKKPAEMVRYTAIVYHLCPPNTPLGQSLSPRLDNVSSSFPQ